MPCIKSVRGFTLAKLIRGETVNPIVFAKHYNMTRLASYIHDLKDRIGASFIMAKPMPLTQGQRKGHTGKPFHSYHLTDAGRKAFDVPEAHQWAREVLEWHRLAEEVAG
ncbi:MAG: hypothetical protein RI556_11230 [Hydrogenovibrio sp.]|uniref:hypothetical protein n=1 Tax=Hydrogenovibrio sp. TaxID=2065821 RepID=UPI0028707AE0|nr:hypothetical protein [Hydrogenovibrio sp.]MDR9499738.1 hypothetical protein [Hydrogenovibrio sp.]